MNKSHLFKIKLPIKALYAPVNVLKELCAKVPMKFSTEGIECFSFDFNNACGNTLRVHGDAYLESSFASGDTVVNCMVEMARLHKVLKMGKSSTTVSLTMVQRDTLSIALHGENGTSESDIKVEAVEEQEWNVPGGDPLCEITIPLANKGDASLCLEEAHKLSQFNQCISLTTAGNRLTLFTAEGCRSSFQINGDFGIKVKQLKPVVMSFQWAYLRVFKMCEKFAPVMTLTCYVPPTGVTGEEVERIARPVAFRAVLEETKGDRGVCTLTEMVFHMMPLTPDL
jgi:hypothetical protein